jgi:putative addiction module component (TIGR02574 family)
MICSIVAAEVTEMTTAQLETVRNEALALSETERARLASDLVASLDGPADPDLADAWDLEICRRINEIEANPAMTLEPEQVLAQARQRIQGE